jgi:hypothetical protein
MAGQVHGQAHGCSRRVQGEKKASCVKMLASRQARHNLFFFLSLSLSLSLFCGCGTRSGARAIRISRDEEETMNLRQAVKGLDLDFEQSELEEKKRKL